MPPLYPESVGLSLDNATLDLLGQARKVVVTKDETTIVEGAGASEQIEGRVRQIRAEIENSDSDYDRRSSRSVSPSSQVALPSSRRVPQRRLSSRSASTVSRTPFATRRRPSKRASSPVVALH